MSRDDVLDLIPLYAGGDLDEASTALMDEAVSAHPECAETLAEYEELEALLVGELTPEAGEEPEWVREALLAGSSPDLTATSTALDAAVSADGVDPIVGKVIGECRVERKLGAGGMGVVYLAEHEPVGRPAVLKILNPALTGSEETVARFFREAQACAQLSHPAVVAIHDVGQDGPYYYIRMEYVEGQNLEELLQAERELAWQTVAEIGVAVAEGLNAAHQRGMIHRDIKPENLMRTPSGQTRVMDFGLARDVHGRGQVSQTGQIVGTPFFMSPEQAGGKPTDARSDLYSLGVTLYYLVTGVKPFMGKNLQEIFLKHFFYAPESPKVYRPELPDAFCDVVMRCLKKKKKERYQSAKALARDLLAVLSDPEASLEVARAGRPPSRRAPRVSEEQPTVKVGADVEGATVRVDSQGDDQATVQVRPEPERAPLRISPPTRGEETVLVDSSGKGAAEATPAPRTRRGRPESPPPPRRRSHSRRLRVALVLAGAVAMGMVHMAVDSLRASYELEPLVVDEMRLQLELQDAEPSWTAAYRWQFLATSYRDTAERVPAVAQEARDRAVFCEERADAITRLLYERRAAMPVDPTRKPKPDAAVVRARFEVLLARHRELLEDEAPFSERADAIARSAVAIASFLANNPTCVELQVLAKQSGIPLGVPVQVYSEPAGATITLAESAWPAHDAKTTPGTVWVRPGAGFRVTLEKHGYRTWIRDDLVAHDRALNVVATLNREALRGPFELGGAMRDRPVGRPVLDDGRLIYVGRSGLLRCVHAARPEAFTRPGCYGPGMCTDGAERPHRIGMFGDPTPPIRISGDVILSASALGDLRAHDVTSGNPLWSFSCGESLRSSPAYVPGEVVAVTTRSGAVLFVDVRTGRERWRFQTEAKTLSAPSLTDRLCVVGTSAGRLHVLDWREQKQVGTVELRTAVTCQPLLTHERVFVGLADGDVAAVDLPRGAEPRIHARFSQPGRAAVRHLELLHHDERLDLLVTTGRQLTTYDLHADKLRWVYESESEISPPTADVTGGQVFVGNQAGELHAVDLLVGRERWRYSAPPRSNGVARAIRYAPYLVGRELLVLTDHELLVLSAD